MPGSILTEFSELGLSPKILATIGAMDYTTPTPIQVDAIPLVLDGHDIMGLAQTGTGKTAAFGLPLVQMLLKGHEKQPPKHVGALILAPTRELVNQISDNLRGFVVKTPLKIGKVVGGSSIHVQIKNLGRGTDILVATPGRLLDLVQRKAVFLSSVRYLVLDEADQMLDLGFIHDLRKIAQLLGTPRQTLLFSATMPKQMEELSQSYLRDPVKVQVSTLGKAADKVTQRVHHVGQRDKTRLLENLLIERRDDLSLVFARTKHGAEKLMKYLVDCGFKAASIHGNKSQGQRERAIRQFRSGDIRILVATDVAARGIDIPGVSHVYNFDLPDVAENYIHRIGRTARAGAEGEAVAFCAPHEFHLLGDIEKLMKMSIPVESGEEPDRRTAKAARNENKRGSGQQQRRSRPDGAGRGRQRKPDGRTKPDASSRPEGRSRPAGSDGNEVSAEPNRKRNTRKPRHASSGGPSYAKSSDRDDAPRTDRPKRPGKPAGGSFGRSEDSRGKPATSKPGERKRGGKPFGKRSGGGGRNSEGRPSNSRSSEGRPAGGKPEGNKRPGARGRSKPRS